jgi:hypothetical protein
MENQLKELETYFNHIEIKKESVSKATVGWQVNHSLLVINGICLSLMRSKEEDYTKKFNMKKAYVFATKKFPKGKAKAPSATNQKEEEITLEGIKKQLKNTYKLLDKINSLPSKSHFKHPLFGKLNLKESKKFLEIHTEHHLKIIRDILR